MELQSIESFIAVHSKVVSGCSYCRNRLTATTCRAFPDLIPLPILSGEVSHTVPYSGDNGIQFEPIDGVAVTEPN
jgi:hypothetical protein